MPPRALIYQARLLVKKILNEETRKFCFGSV
jgi:hypothetical protein